MAGWREKDAAGAVVVVFFFGDGDGDVDVTDGGGCKGGRRVGIFSGARKAARRNSPGARSKLEDADFRRAQAETRAGLLEW